MEELAAVENCIPTPQPVHPDIRATDMNLKLREGVTYIVAGVVIQDGKVLLIQEAKLDCRGEWYLPAGRMERNESIVEAVKREVLEESGFEFEPEVLIAVESHSHFWVRFTLTGRITGGSLKTTDQADSESLQAEWFTTDLKRLVLDTRLRARDILRLIELGTEWYDSRVYSGLPVGVGHVSSSQRLVLVHDSGQELKVLLSKEGGSTRLPVCLFQQGRYGGNAVDTTIKACGYNGRYKECGILSVEHLGKPYKKFDGFCATFILKAETADLTRTRGQTFEWTVVTGDLAEKLKRAMTDGGCARFMEL